MPSTSACGFVVEFKRTSVISNLRLNELTWFVLVLFVLEFVFKFGLLFMGFLLVVADKEPPFGVEVVVLIFLDFVPLVLLLLLLLLWTLGGGGGGFIIANFILLWFDDDGFVIFAVSGFNVAISLWDFEIVSCVCFCDIILNLEKFSLDAEVCKLLDLRVDNLGVVVQDIVVDLLMFNGSVIVLLIVVAVVVLLLSCIVLLVIIEVLDVFVEVLVVDLLEIGFESVDFVVIGLCLTLVLGDRGELLLKVEVEEEVEGEEEE